MPDLFHIYYLRLLSLVLAVFALWMVAKYQKTPAIWGYAGFFLGLSAIALLDTLIISPLSVTSALWVTRLGYFSGVFTFSCLIIFSWFYPIPSKNLPKNYALFWLVPLVFFFPLIFLSPEFVRGVESIGNGYKENVGWAYPLFPIFAVVSYILVLRNLFRKIKLTSHDQQWRVKSFFVILILTAGVGVIFDVLVPAVTHLQWHLWGIESSGLIALSSLYIVMKK